MNTDDNDILRELLGKPVEVRSQANNYDDGVLEAYDARWLKLRKESGEALFFPIANVRLLKSRE